jgi:hypothetical protein
VDIDLEPVMRDALTKGDPKILLSLALTIIVFVLREKVFAKNEAKHWLGRLLRWLGTTHLGGIVSSMVGSGLGAVISALGTQTWPSPWAIVNVFLIAAAASGIATWSKWRKQGDDKIANGAGPGADDPPPLPPSGMAGMLLVLSGAASLLGGCATLRDGLTAFKGDAAYAVLGGARATLAWDKEEQMRIAKIAPTREAGEAELKAQRKKRDEILDGFASAADALRVYADALASYDATKGKSWWKLARAVLDAFDATRQILSRYDVKILLPDLKLPKVLGGVQ